MRSVHSDFMTWTALAEAGLSECARTEMDCMPGFGSFLALAALTILGVIAWVTLSACATLSIADSNQTVLRKLVWSIAVLGIPIFGAILWFAAPARMGP